MQVLIRIYQRTLGTMWNCCRFYPSCSQYALEAFQRHNWFKAFWLMLKRIAKCGPWHPGGCDPCP